MVKVGNTLTATAASVTGDPTPVRSWQWLRNGATISGATGSTYVAAAADEGSQLSVRQIETNVAGVAVATSAATTTVQAFDPAALFASSEVGAWYDPSDSSTVWQDAAGTIPAGNGDPVGRIDDKSGNGNHATQTTSAARPVLVQSGSLWYLDFDGVDDSMAVTFAAAQAQPNSIGAGFKFDNYTTRQYDFVYDSPAALGTGERHTLNDDSGNFLVYAGNSVVFASTDLADHVSVTHYNTTSSTIRLDGSVASTGNVGSRQWGGVVLGGSFSQAAGYGLDGRIYSFVGVNRTLTTAETLGLESYLANKSGVTL